MYLPTEGQKNIKILLSFCPYVAIKSFCPSVANPWTYGRDGIFVVYRFYQNRSL